MAIRLPICIALALALAGTLHVSANVVDMRCEYRVDPIGIDATAPRLTWTYDSDDIPDHTAEFRSGHHKFKISKISEATRLSGSLDFTFF